MRRPVGHMPPVLKNPRSAATVSGVLSRSLHHCLLAKPVHRWHPFACDAPCPSGSLHARTQISSLSELRPKLSPHTLCDQASKVCICVHTHTHTHTQRLHVNAASQAKQLMPSESKHCVQAALTNFTNGLQQDLQHAESRIDRGWVRKTT